MINAISNVAGLSIDAEHLKIIQELRRMGLEPTGVKSTDAQKLAKAKAELIQKIHKKEEVNATQSLGIQIINSVDEKFYTERSEMEQQRLGAMTVAELNKFYFRL